MFTFHLEDENFPQLVEKIRTALVRLEKSPLSSTPPAPKPEAKEAAPAPVNGDATPAPKAAKTTKAPAAPKVTLDEVKLALTALKDAQEKIEPKTGMARVHEVLAKFAVTKTSQLKEADFAQAVTIATEMAANIAGGGGAEDDPMA